MDSRVEQPTMQLISCLLYTSDLLHSGSGMYDLSDDRNCKETGIFAGAFAAGSFLCDDRIWNWPFISVSFS